MKKLKEETLALKTEMETMKSYNNQLLDSFIDNVK